MVSTGIHRQMGCSGKVPSGCEKNILYHESESPLQWVSHGGCGVTLAGNIQICLTLSWVLYTKSLLLTEGGTMCSQRSFPISVLSSRHTYYQPSLLGCELLTSKTNPSQFCIKYLYIYMCVVVYGVYSIVRVRSIFVLGFLGFGAVWFLFFF